MRFGVYLLLGGGAGGVLLGRIGRIDPGLDTVFVSCVDRGSGVGSESVSGADRGFGVGFESVWSVDHGFGGF